MSFIKSSIDSWQTYRKALLLGPTVLRLSGPIIVVGDVHGQFQSVLSLFEQYGHPPASRYLFLGDFVDR